MFRSLTLAAIAALATAAAGTAALAGDVLDRVASKGVLVMAADPDYPPQSSQTADGGFIGFDIDVGTEIARRMGVDIEFVAPGWDVITAGGWAGRWDISVGSMTPTPERTAVLDFPAVYYFTPAVLVVHRSNISIAGPADASGGTIGVGVATTYEAYLNKSLVIDAEGAMAFAFKIDNADVKTFETDVQALEALSAGDGAEIDAAFTALPTVMEAQRNGAPIKVVGSPLFLEPLAIAIDKGDPAFGREIARIVDEMRLDGTLRGLSRKWYGADFTR